jgi:hypothetical protein
VAFDTTVTRHFTIVHGAGADDIADTGKALEAAYRRFHDVFAKAGFELSRSQDRLVWICFPQQSGFNKYALRTEGMDLSWLDGYYSTLTNRVAVVQPNMRVAEREPAIPSQTGDLRITLAANPLEGDEVLAMSSAESRLDMTRLTHELAHQLAFNSGLQKRGVMYPVWVSEGLATNFECSEMTSAGLALPNTGRSKCLATAHLAGELIPLREFVVQTRMPVDVQVSRRHYAQAWGFFQFLLTERPGQLRDYLQRTAKLRVGRRETWVLRSEFTAAFGSPEALEPAWKAFVARQTREVPADSQVASIPADAYPPSLK